MGRLVLFVKVIGSTHTYTFRVYILSKIPCGLSDLMSVFFIRNSYQTNAAHFLCFFIIVCVSAVSWTIQARQNIFFTLAGGVNSNFVYENHSNINKESCKSIS